MKVTVTQRHIDEGRKHSHQEVTPRSAWCPIALAVKELTKSDYVFASTYFIKVDGKRYDTPTKAHMFMIDFDRGNPVQPFEFEMEPARFDLGDGDVVRLTELHGYGTLAIKLIKLT